MRLRILGGIALVLGLFAFNAYYPLQDVLLDLVTWFETMGPFSVVLFIILFTVCSLFFVPVSPLMMVAGTLYGFWRGYLLAAVSGLTGIAVAYWLGKKLWRKRV